MERPIIAALMLLFSSSLPLLAEGDTGERKTEPLYGPVDLSQDDESPMAEHLRQAVEFRTQLVSTFPAGPNGTEEEYARWQRLAGASVSEYIAAVRATDFSSDAPLYLHEPPLPKVNSWYLTKATHRDKELHEALIDQLLICRPHRASFHTAALVSWSSDETEWVADAGNLHRLIKTLLERQPHLLRYWIWNKLVVSADMLGMHDEATALAQVVALAPLKEPPLGFSLPYHRPDEGWNQDPERLRLQASGPLLACGLRSRPDEFTDRLWLAATRDFGAHGQLVLWMKARACSGSLQGADMGHATCWYDTELLVSLADIVASADVGQSRTAFDHLLIEAMDISRIPSGPFYFPTPEEWSIANEQMSATQTPAVQQYLREHLQEWIKATKATPQGGFPSARLLKLFLMACSLGSQPLQNEIAQKWIDEFPVAATPSYDPSSHASMMAKAALKAPRLLGARLANRAADSLIEAAKTPDSRFSPRTEDTRVVFQALLATGQHERLGWLCAVLGDVSKKAFKPGINIKDHPLPIQSVTAEAHSLNRVLLKDPGHMPGARAWIRNAKSSDAPPEIAWELIAPIEVPEGYSRDGMACLRGVCKDAWGNGQGLRTPLLQTISGTYDLSFEAGTSPGDLRPVAMAAESAASGTKTLGATLPRCGFVRSVVRDRTTRHTVVSPPRPYSLEPPLVASGPEPEGACGASYFAPSTEIERRPQALHPLEFRRIDPNQPLLLTTWNPRKMLMDGTSEDGALLDSVCIAFATEEDVSHIVSFLPVSEFAAEGNDPYAEDGPSAPLQYHIFVPAILAAQQLPPSAKKNPQKPAQFVTVLYSSGGKNARMPLFQLRPFVPAKATN